MTSKKIDDGSKKAKTIAAVIYLIVLTFLVGGSYINQQHAGKTEAKEQVVKAE